MKTQQTFAVAALLATFVSALASAQSSSIEMVALEGGTFTMGDTVNEAPFDYLRPHEVTVSPFSISRTELTAFQYRSTLGAQLTLESVSLPIARISWYAAVDYCNRLSRAAGYTPAYIFDHSGVHWDRRANGYRLPTEAEWEYAAKGGAENQSLKYTGSDDIEAVGWYSGNSMQKMQPVAMKAPNAFGLYDMTGNVREWCFDYYENPIIDARDDPFDPLHGRMFRVSKGGNYVSDKCLIFQ